MSDRKLAEHNLTEALKRAMPSDATIVVSGEVVQGRLSPLGERCVEIQRLIRELPDEPSQADTDKLDGHFAELLAT